MNKMEIYDYLNSLNIWYEVTEHGAVFNMAEMSAIDLPYPEADAKNLFVRDDKKRNYYLITVKGDKKVNLKDFRQANNTRPLSFASETDLMSVMGLIGVHPNENTATVWMKTEDLIRIVKEHGNELRLAEI